MNYYIQRGTQQYGPYSLADLQRYVQQGNIVPNDLARSEGMTDWVPVSTIIGNVAAAPPSVPAFGAGAGSPYGAPMGQPGAPMPYGTNSGTYGYGMAAQPIPGWSQYPAPPSLHWGLVLLISLLCGWFQVIWLFVQLSWVQKVRPQCNARVLHISALATILGGLILGVIVAGASNGNQNMASVGGGIIIIAVIAAIVMTIMGNFSMRDATEDFYNTEEPIGLSLSGVM